jgi:D-sedoheptulose 7-phosphate isomerase
MLNSKEKFSKFYKKKLISIIESVSNREISKFIDALLSIKRQNNTIYFIGNGGSASTASHFVNDLSIGLKTLNRSFRAISLCDNQSIITAIANDYGYENIFSKQLSILLREGDMVVAISASGNSPNLIKAIELAKKMDAITVGITAFDGGRLKNMVDLLVHVPTDQGDYGPAEDVHMMLDHLISNYLMDAIDIE